MVSVSPWTEGTFDVLYKIFEADFKNKPLKYKGFNVWFFPEMREDKEMDFLAFDSREDEETKIYYPD